MYIYILFFYWHFTKRSANPCLGISRHGRADIMFCIGKRRNLPAKKLVNIKRVETEQTVLLILRFGNFILV